MRDVYPLTQINDILDTIGDAKYLSSLDLVSGYWQVELDKDIQKKSAFATFQRLMQCFCQVWKEKVVLCTLTMF